MRCSSCNEFFDQDTWLSQPAEWRESGHVIRIHKSFQCSALISPLIRWETIDRRFQGAVHALEAGDSSLMQVFENSQTWAERIPGRVEKMEAAELYGRREVF